MQIRKIRYIGKNKTKGDNITPSNAHWDYPGQVREVTQEVAVRLLQYPTVWVEAGAENDPGDKAIYEVITGTNESHFVNTKGEVVKKGSQPVAEPSKVEAIVTPSGFAYSNDPTTAIEQAIRQLDPDNDNHFTGQGLPRVEAIEMLLGYPVRADKRTEVWERLQDENPSSLDEMIGNPTEEMVVQ